MTIGAWRKARPSLIGFFEVRDGLLIQKRVEHERGRASEITEKRSKAGKASAEAKAQQKVNKSSTQCCSKRPAKRKTFTFTRF
jgi:uncharacterized protein YdaU (DUF1376 family)